MQRQESVVSSMSAVTTLVAQVAQVTGWLLGRRRGWSHGETVNRASPSTEFAGLSADAMMTRRGVSADACDHVFASLFR